MASARPPTKRATALARLDELLARVEQLNADDRWCDRVDVVVLFGSLLDERVAEVSDVDLAIEFSRRLDVEEDELERRA